MDGNVIRPPGDSEPSSRPAVQEWWRYDPARLDWAKITIGNPADLPLLTPAFFSRVAVGSCGVVGGAALTGVAVLFVTGDGALAPVALAGAFVLAVLVLLGVRVGAHTYARARSRHVIAGTDVAGWPAEVRKPLARAVLAARDLTASRSLAGDFLGETDYAAVLWQMAVTGQRIAALAQAGEELRKETTSDMDQAAARQARAVIEPLIADLNTDADELVAAADAARELAKRVVTAEAADAAESLRDEHAAPRTRRREQVHMLTAELSASAATYTGGGRDVADQTIARAAAYDDVAALGDGRAADRGTPPATMD